MSALYFPGTPEGWEWHTARWLQQPEPGDLNGYPRPKIRVALLNPTGVERDHGTIDVELYGDTAAVVELARGLIERVEVGT